MHFCI